MIKLVNMQKGIEASFLDEFKKRGNSSMEEAVETASEIIKMVRSEGDTALYKLTKRFDGVDLKGTGMEESGLQVTEEEMEKAYKAVDSELLMTIRNAAENIRDFHSRQLEQSWLYVGKEGALLGQIVNPLDRVGVYVPGGTAPLISSVLKILYCAPLLIRRQA